MWRTVQAAGVVHGIYCPARLLDRPEILTALRPGAGGRLVSLPAALMIEHAQAVVDALQRFEFTYPFVMACVWMAGALFYWWFEERGGPRHDQPPAMTA